MKQSLNKHRTLLAAALLACGAVLPALSKTELPTFQLAVKDHQFSPANLVVPAGQKFKLVIVNQDKAPMEFESFLLHREQVVVGGGQGTIFLGPLKEGRYEFFDDFHSQTKGVLEAAPAEAKK